MENDLISPLHLEFYGLPGCGKSTVSHKLAEELRKLEYKVNEPSYEIDRVKGGFLVRKLNKVLLLGLCRILNRDQYTIIKDIVAKNGYVGKSCLSQEINIVHKLRAYNSKSQADIIIWDQGLVQAAVSLSTNGNVPSFDNYIALKEACSESHVYPIYMKCDIDTSLKRMDGRNTNDSRVERLKTEDDKREMLRGIEVCCDNVLSDVSFEIDCKNESLDSINSILLNKVIEIVKRN